DVVTDGADVANGRQLYVANCAACHGPAAGGGAVGGGFVAPPLAPADATQIGEAALGGPGPMPRFSFTPQQLNDLAAYVRSLPTAPHPGGLTSPAVGPVTEGFIAGIALLLILLVARWIAIRQGSGQ
ncbi:MAG TPA: c-type cytochrome, partial [Candidatus Binatus sp.]|nr:c-type cytochrome [Candidatus Binatus sp.]